MTVSTPPRLGDFPEFAEVPPGPLPSGGEAHTPGFRLAVFPITVAQYRRYLLDTGLDRRPDNHLHGFSDTAGAGLHRTGAVVVVEPQLTTLPVTGVTWHGAVAYCAWLGARTGVSCRLPTAAEWQYAAAGPHGWRWALGDEFDRPTYAPPASRPRPVDASPANAYGLRDMTGNVFEWCADALTVGDGPESTTLAARAIKGGAFTVRNPESFENSTTFTADELTSVSYIGFRSLIEVS